MCMFSIVFFMFLGVIIFHVSSVVFHIFISIYLPFQVYFFNLTNPEEFFSGHSKPVLEEIGPFTYW
jgi:hypothetical protein